MGGRKTKAVTLMLLSALSFSFMQVFVKLSSSEVGTFEQVFFRNLVSLFIAGITVRKEKIDLIPEMKKAAGLCGAVPFLGFWALFSFSMQQDMPDKQMSPC